MEFDGILLTIELMVIGVLSVEGLTGDEELEGLVDVFGNVELDVHELFSVGDVEDFVFDVVLESAFEEVRDSALDVGRLLGERLEQFHDELLDVLLNGLLVSVPIEGADDFLSGDGDSAVAQAVEEVLELNYKNIKVTVQGNLRCWSERIE